MQTDTPTELIYQDQFQITEDKGYLPILHPITVLPSQFSKMEEILQKMPFTLENGDLGLIGQQKLALTVDEELPDYYDEILKIDSIHLLSALFRDYCFLSVAYLLEDCHHYYLNNDRRYVAAKQILPQKLAKPLCYVSSKVGAQPWLDYSRAHILNNYYLKDESQGFKEENIGFRRLWVGNPGEIGFSMTHILVAQRSPIMITAINRITELVRAGSQRELVNAQLETLQEMIYECAAEMKEMYHRNSVDEFYLFRTFMSGAKNSIQFPEGVIFQGVSEEPKFIRGSSAALDLTIPILDTFLGLTDSFPQNELKDLHTEYRQYMPPLNVKYLDKLKTDRIELDLFNYYKADPQTLYLYLQCIDGIRRFRETHWNFIIEYILKREKMATGTGGSNPIFFLPFPILAIISHQLTYLGLGQAQAQDKKLVDKYAKLTNLVKRAKQKIDDIVSNVQQSHLTSYSQELILDQSPETYTLEFSQKLDREDKLRAFKEDFHKSDGSVYMATHKLGLGSKKFDQVEQEMKTSWQSSGMIKKHEYEGLEQMIVSKLAFLLGSFDYEVGLTNSRAIALHQLLSIFNHSDKKQIAMTESNTSSLKYTKQWLQDQGLTTSETLLVIKQDINKPGLQTITDTLYNHGSEIGVLILNYSKTTGLTEGIDLVSLIKVAHTHNIKVILDISQSIGAVRVNLHDWNVDAAIFNTDKYLNAGLGAVAGVFVHQNHRSLFQSKEVGEVKPAKIIDTLTRFKLSSFDPLHLARLNSSLETFLQAGNINVWGKNTNLAKYLIHLVSSIKNIKIVTANYETSGQMSIKPSIDGKNTIDLYQVLTDSNIICEYKQTSEVVVLSVNSLINSFEDIHRCFQLLLSTTQ